MTVMSKVDFLVLKKSVQKKFTQLQGYPLFQTEVDRDRIWDTYLQAFPEEDRQEHNCNCCRAFLRQFGGLVAIVGGERVSLWDLEGDLGQYEGPVKSLAAYIRELPISSALFVESQKAGTDHNTDRKTGVTWNHFFLELPRSYVRAGKTLGTLIGESRSSYQVFKRALDEIPLDVTQTVLDLIGQNSIYRGKEQEPLLKKFKEAQQSYKQSSQKEAYAWLTSGQGGALAHIRNSAVGTLLVNIAEGMDLGDAVEAFGRVMDPHNYKRPTSISTPRMVEEARRKLEELGYLGSLERRYAHEADLNINDIIFSDRTQAAGDVFSQMTREAVVNPRSFGKVEEIGMEDFLQKVVPTARSLYVLLENQHLDKMVTLLTGPEPSMFKWGNPFSWSYTGGTTDTIKERVKQAGGRVEGELRCSLSWSNFDDLDLHVVQPDGVKIYYRAKKDPRTGGWLDVDMNAGGGTTRTPVENIIFQDKGRMKEGKYQVLVNQYAKRETDKQGYTVQIECQGQMVEFYQKGNPATGKTVLIAELEYTRAEGMQISQETKAAPGREKWGLTTNQWHRVQKVLLSPNHWGPQPVGNRHYFFILEGCQVSEEEPRPFFNEYLRQELEAHRKVLETLGGKVRIPPSVDQLSGLGFSDTQENTVIVKVEGKFTRTLRVRVK